MMDFDKFIRTYCHMRHHPNFRPLLKQALNLRRNAKKHGMHKAWAHKPIGGDR